MIFVHWGYRFRDGMDLDPATYNSFRRGIGPDPSKWCVKDATYDAFASTHMENLDATGYHHITTTAEFESIVRVDITKKIMNQEGI